MNYASTIRRWTSATLPRRRLIHGTNAPGTGFDFHAAMDALCRELVARIPDLSHVDMNGVLVTAICNRRHTRHGVQARLTGLRGTGGSITRRVRGWLYATERIVVDGHEVLYLVTFVMPRFLDEPTLHEKVATIIHELYHIAPAFDGSIRGHGRSKEVYHERMRKFATQYMDALSDCSIVQFLRPTLRDYSATHGGILVPMIRTPRLFPVAKITDSTAATPVPTAARS